MLERRGPRLSRRFAAKRAANGCQPCNYPVELFLYLGMFFGESCRVSTTHSVSPFHYWPVGVQSIASVVSRHVPVSARAPAITLRRL